MKPQNTATSSAEKRLNAIRTSPNFRNGKFQNLHETPQLTEGGNVPGIMWHMLVHKNKRRLPTGLIPSVFTDLHRLDAATDVLVWFGHSSYFMQVAGKTFLIDPVFSGNASPVRGTNRSFKGSDRYTPADMPPIDFLFLSHDHYDHADHPTLVALQPKVKQVLCGLGVGALMEKWGYPAGKIMEKDWDETVELAAGITVHTASARHFSGRGLVRNTTLWLSFIVQTPSLTLYLGGDSGYDTHFADIGRKFGPFDLAILENGQSNKWWKHIHMEPAEVLQAALDLKARRLFPVHSSKFALANHAWDEPLMEITRLNKATGLPLVTPMIGEPVYLSNPEQAFTPWWAGIN